MSGPAVQFHSSSTIIECTVKSGDTAWRAPTSALARAVSRSDALIVRRNAGKMRFSTRDHWLSRSSGMAYDDTQVVTYIRQAHGTTLLSEREKHLIGLAVTM